MSTIDDGDQTMPIRGSRKRCQLFRTCKAFWSENGRAVFSKKIADMPIWRQYNWMADANGKMYAIGGWTTAKRSKNVWSIQEYDPSLNRWNTFGMLE